MVAWLLVRGVAWACVLSLAARPFSSVVRHIPRRRLSKWSGTAARSVWTLSKAWARPNRHAYFDLGHAGCDQSISQSNRVDRIGLDSIGFLINRNWECVRVSSLRKHVWAAARRLNQPNPEESKTNHRLLYVVFRFVLLDFGVVSSFLKERGLSVEWVREGLFTDHHTPRSLSSPFSLLRVLVGQSSSTLLLPATAARLFKRRPNILAGSNHLRPNRPAAARAGRRSCHLSPRCRPPRSAHTQTHAQVIMHACAPIPSRSCRQISICCMYAGGGRL